MLKKKIIIVKIRVVKELRPHENIPINFVLYELLVDTDTHICKTIIVDETDYEMIKELGYYYVKLSDWES